LVKKFTLLFAGALFALSLTLPPNIGKIFLFEYSDIPVVFLFLILLLSNLRNYRFKNSDYLWLGLILLFVLFSFFDWLNPTSLRFIFYFMIGLLVKKASTNLNISDFELLFLPLVLVSALSLFSFLFDLSFLNNSIGWITNYSDTNNIFFSGRLAGFQGSGPNVAGTIFGLLTILSFYFYKKTVRNLYLILIFVNLFLFFITYSRGSYLALLIISIIYILSKIKNNKFKIFYIVGIITSSLILLYFGPSDVILKENDRSLLASIALSNIELVNGVGGGRYVEKIYEPYLLSVNPDLLEENLKITLNKVELGITPEEFRDSNINFFIGTSGGGFEILQQYFIVGQCSDDRNTCQYLRVAEDTVINFLNIFKLPNQDLVKNVANKCIDNSKKLVTRGEFACIAFELNLMGDNFNSFEFYDLDNKNDSNKHFSYLKSNALFIECEASKMFSCKDRPLAIGELSVIVENLFIRDNLLPLDNLDNFCKECEFRSIDGYIKIKFDKYDYFLPRSKVSFFTSEDNLYWDIVGYPHYTGEVINLINNNGLIEIGGHADGQSFGNTFLDANIKSIEIISKNEIKKVEFNEDNLNKKFFIYKPNSLNLYNSKITFEDQGLKLFRPNKYWVTIENQFDFNEDFEIVLHLSFPEIPWQTQTLISNTSAFTGDTQSWKVDIDDGRLFFNWTNSDGEYVNQLGDKSLRSGVLVQKNGKIANEQPPLASSSYLSQLTTAHNGYLTFFVEYGLLQGLVFFIILIFLVFNKFNSMNDEKLILIFSLLYFLIHNITNDLIYSPDSILFFMILLGIKESITDQVNLEK
tara:strand:- start:122797 stop:125223 length:2427 start_codon:yes stop_codon:yes gene_type:complete